MKIKSLILTLIVFLTLSLSSYSQSSTALNIHGGYSWLNGVVGGEAQFGKFGISGGWMPTSMPITGERVNSYGFAASIYSGGPDETSTWYLSGGVASDGYQYEDSYGYGTTSPVTIFMIGTKYNFGGIYSKLGCGYGWCSDPEIGTFTFEFVLGFTLFNSNK